MWEAVGLALAIDLNVVGSELVNLAEIRPATYLGKGKAAELEALIERTAPSRSQSLALTELELSVMWAIKGLTS